MGCGLSAYCLIESVKGEGKPPVFGYSGNPGISLDPAKAVGFAAGTDYAAPVDKCSWCSVHSPLEPGGEGRLTCTFACLPDDSHVMRTLLVVT